MIRQLAFAGVVDFSKADVLDRQWWRRLYWLSDQMEDRSLKEIYRLQQLQHLLTMPVSTVEGIKKSWEEANQALIAYFDQCFPWLEKEAKRGSKTADDLAEAWARTWGDPNDPETQKKIWATVEMLQPQPVKR